MGTIVIVMFLLFAALCIGGAIYFVFFLAKNKSKKNSFTAPNLLKVYLYAISFVTLIIAVVGSSVTLNALFSLKYGDEFSFDIQEPYPVYVDESGKDTTETTCYQGTLTEIDNQKVCFDNDTPKRHIVNGLSVTISMLILFVIHRIGIYLVEKKGELKWLKKTYHFLSLIVFSIGGVITIPIAAYQLLNYIYFKPEEIIRITPPGLALSLALLIIPFWIYFLISTVKIKEDED